jgi:hypothetical protein
MSGGVIIPANKKTNVKVYIIKRPPTDPFQYGLDHFTRKQSKMIGLLLDKMSESDLDIFKFFDFYGVFAYQCSLFGPPSPLTPEEEAQISSVSCFSSPSSDHTELDEETLAWIDEMIEKHSKATEMMKRFDKKYCPNRPPRNFFDTGPRDEYERLITMEGVKEALVAIYEARFFKK